MSLEQILRNVDKERDWNFPVHFICAKMLLKDFTPVDTLNE